MNMLTKIMPLAVASFLAMSPAFSNQKSKPEMCKPATEVLPCPQMPTIAAYNAPAEIHIGMPDDYDFFATANFLYWQPIQDNMGAAVTAEQPIAVLGVPIGQGTVVNMDFDYKPGFKAGLGMNLCHDDWVGYAEYTRVHGEHHVSASSASTDPRIYAMRGHPFQLANIGQVFSDMHSSYGCNLDFIDGQMERVYYVGQKFVLHSSVGMRGAWILQRWHNNYNGTVARSGLAASAINGELNVYERTHSWAVGPRGGLKMDWMFGRGFRFYGTGFADILYTKYKLQTKSVVVTREAVVGVLAPGQSSTLILSNEVPAVRAHADFELGLGWGSCFRNNRWHVDFAVGYDFQVFFNQDVFTHFEDSAALAVSSYAFSNLYMQGLNVSARLDF